jgi:PcfJ-like protein
MALKKQDKKIILDIQKPKKVKPQWELLFSGSCPRVDRLIEVYKENPKNARIIFFQGQKAEFTHNRCIAYTFDNGDINIVVFEKSYGISVTNKMYNSEKNIMSIIYKKGTNKWYFRHNNIKNLNFSHIMMLTSMIYPYSQRLENPVFDYLLLKLPWIRNIVEDKHQISWKLPFDTIIKHKLFNLKSIYRHMFNVSYPLIDMMLTSKFSNTGDNCYYFFTMFKEMKKVLLNIESLKPEMFTHHMFMDTCKMAASVGEKVNCQWGIKRFVEEHDKWSKEITNVLLLNQKKTPLLIHQVYEEFANFSGLRMLLTNYDMVEDGMVMQHCVGSYISNVNRGECAIYKIDGYTMEIKKSADKRLHWAQIRGVKNVDCPNQVKIKVQNLLDTFNLTVLPSIEFRAVNADRYEPTMNEYDDLPF